MPSGQSLVTVFRRLALPLATVAAATFACSAGPASAQGLLDLLFGGFRRELPPPVQPYANPNSDLGDPLPQGSVRPSADGPAVSYCVRTCDGRYFPMQRHAGATPVQLCNSFCPAAQTKVYYGSNIEGALSNDGRTYSELANAFVYRDRVVDGCTCNGKDPYGLAAVDINKDPTLRPGDVVVTSNGMVAYNGKSRNETAQFTPINSYRGLSSETRRILNQTPINTAAATPAPVAATDISASRADPSKRAQLSDR